MDSKVSRQLCMKKNYGPYTSGYGSETISHQLKFGRILGHPSQSESPGVVSPRGLKWCDRHMRVTLLFTAKSKVSLEISYWALKVVESGRLQNLAEADIVVEDKYHKGVSVVG